MIEKMTKYSFILVNGDNEKFLSELQETGIVDITRSAKPIDTKSSEMLSRAENLGKAIIRLGEADFSKDPSVVEYKKHGPSDFGDPVERLYSVTEELKQTSALLETANKDLAVLQRWGNFDRTKIAEIEKRGLKINFYECSEKSFVQEWQEQVALQIIERTDGKIWFVTVNEKEDFAIPLQKQIIPEMSMEEAAAKIAELKETLFKLNCDLFYLAENKTNLIAERRKILSELDMYLAEKSYTDAGDNVILLYEGFAPTKNDEELCKKLDTLPAYYLKEAAKAEDNPPIQLTGNKFTKMFIVLTDMYGRPGYNEFDPTPYISIFFLLFFAMCMGDAGYGLAMIIIGLLLRRKEQFKEMAPLVITLGIGTAVIGTFMHTFFGADFLQYVPESLQKFMIQGKIAGFEASIVISIIVGIIHLCCAMVVKTVYATRNNGFLQSLGIWGWTTLIVGGVIIGTLMVINILPVTVAKWIFIVMGLISALGIFLFNDIKSNPIKNIGTGLWETYNTATGLLGDVLSYLRLYALGLAGGMLGQAFNQIAMLTLGKDGFGLKPGLIAFAAIVVTGHSLNLAMCCLGSFVHPLRLNFLEFFKNSGYEGKGRTYKPIKK